MEQFLGGLYAKAKFPQGWKTLKPYLRVTKQPGV